MGIHPQNQQVQDVQEVSSKILTVYLGFGSDIWRRFSLSFGPKTLFTNHIARFFQPWIFIWRCF